MNFQEPVLQHRFRGHTVAVQGAASELGHAVAVRFAAEGAQVVLIDRDEALLQRRAAGLVPSRVLVSGRDPQDAAQADELMAQVHRRFGPLGTWINVFGDEGGTAWPVAGCEAALSDLVAQDGSVIHLWPDAGLRASVVMETVARRLRAARRPAGVRINTVAGRGGADAAVRRDMATLACFLASAQARCLDGVLLPVQAQARALQPQPQPGPLPAGPVAVVAPLPATGPQPQPQPRRVAGLALAR